MVPTSECIGRFIFTTGAAPTDWRWIGDGRTIASCISPFRCHIDLKRRVARFDIGKRWPRPIRFSSTHRRGLHECSQDRGRPAVKASLIPAGIATRPANGKIIDPHWRCLSPPHALAWSKYIPRHEAQALVAAGARDARNAATGFFTKSFRRKPPEVNPRNIGIRAGKHRRTRWIGHWETAENYD